MGATSPARRERIYDAVAAPEALPAGQQIAAALDVLARQLQPLAASFYCLGRGGEVGATVVGCTGSPATSARKVAAWRRKLEPVSSLPFAALARLPHRLVTHADLGRGDRHPVFDVPARLRAYRRLGVIDDVVLPIRDGERPIAAIALWRPLYGREWNEGQLRVLEGLQPLVERGYLGELREREGFEAGLPTGLTRRQRQVARLLASGATDREVADALCVGRETVKSHVRAVLRGLDADSRSEIALRFGANLGAPAGALGPSEGSSTAARLLQLLLDWASRRIGTSAGSCLLLSARGEPLTEATVGQLSPTRQRPLTLTLRLPGRGAARIQVAPAACLPLERRQCEAELRAAQPLLEGAFADLLRASGAATMRGGGSAAGRLTPRERQVAELGIVGADNAEIARRLCIARSTAENHMAEVLAKSGAGSRAQLVAMYAAPRSVPKFRRSVYLK